MLTNINNCVTKYHSHLIYRKHGQLDEEIQFFITSNTLNYKLTEKNHEKSLKCLKLILFLFKHG